VRDLYNNTTISEEIRELKTLMSLPKSYHHSKGTNVEYRIKK